MKFLAIILALALPPAIYFPALLSLVLGNFLALYMGLIAIRVARRPYLLVAALLAPAYWVMMSIAALKALAQLLSAPSFWEKTAHGLDGSLVRVGGSDVPG